MAANQVPSKSSEITRRGGDLTPFGEFTFPLSRIRDEFDRLFNRMSHPWASLGKFNGEGWRWGLDVDDQEDNVVVRAEAPGFEANDFDVSVEDSRLILRAAKKSETKDEKGKVQEYREQECYESVTLPTSVDKNKVDAKYRNGVLTVTLPKIAEAKPKKILVKPS